MEARYVRLGLSYSGGDILVARKLVPAPTKKLNTTGTARSALTCILQPTMSVATIVTLAVSFRVNNCKLYHLPSLIREEHESGPFQPEIV